MQRHEVRPVNPALTPAPLVVEQPVVERKQTGKRRRRSRLRWFLLTLLLAALLGLLGGLLYVRDHFEGRIYPNIAIYGVNVGDRSPEEARAALERPLRRFLRQPVELTFANRTWQPSLQDLGVQVDIDGAVESAYRIGRGLDLLATVEQIHQTWQRGRQLPLQVTIDTLQLQRYLQSLAPGIERAPRDAQLVIRTDYAEIIPAQEGRMLLVDETAAEILVGLQELRPEKVALRTRTLAPRLREEGIAEAAQLIDSVLQGPLTLNFAAKEQTWELSQSDLRALIRITREQGPEQDWLRAEVDLEPIRRQLAAIGEEIYLAPIRPRVQFAGGKLSIIKAGRNGRRLDEAASLEQVRAQLTSPERSVNLVVNEVEPPVTAANLHTLGIKEAVGVGKSSFKGSAPYRIQNIKAGSWLLHGRLIAPGEEFSFNRAVGSISPQNGFVEGYAIVNNRTQLEYGGGICQDSTTLFRAAFYAGLPFTEWHHHSFRISWYEAFEPYGMDATIYIGALDLRFVNDTGHWLLLQTYVDEARQELTYALYGTRPNRRVIRSEPMVSSTKPAPRQPVYVPDSSIPVGQFKQSDVARDGMTITIYRVITQNGQVIKRQPFVTTFKPWPNIFLHNPKTRLPPAGCLPNQPCAAARRP